MHLWCLACHNTFPNLHFICWPTIQFVVCGWVKNWLYLKPTFIYFNVAREKWEDLVSEVRNLCHDCVMLHSQRLMWSSIVTNLLYVHVQHRTHMIIMWLAVHSDWPQGLRSSTELPCGDPQLPDWRGGRGRGQQWTGKEGRVGFSCPLQAHQVHLQLSDIRTVQVGVCGLTCINFLNHKYDLVFDTLYHSTGVLSR